MGTNKSLLEGFVKHTKNLNIKDAQGRTPLHYAYPPAIYAIDERFDYKGVISHLIRNGADSSIKDNYGLTAEGAYLKSRENYQSEYRKAKEVVEVIKEQRRIEQERKRVQQAQLRKGKAEAQRIRNMQMRNSLMTFIGAFQQGLNQHTQNLTEALQAQIIDMQSTNRDFPKSSETFQPNSTKSNTQSTTQTSQVNSYRCVDTGPAPWCAGHCGEIFPGYSGHPDFNEEGYRECREICPNGAYADNRRSRGCPIPAGGYHRSKGGVSKGVAN